MPFGEFESRVDKKGQAILTLGTTTLWVSVNSFPSGQELRSCISTETQRETQGVEGASGHFGKIPTLRTPRRMGSQVEIGPKVGAARPVSKCGELVHLIAISLFCK